MKDLKIFDKFIKLIHITDFLKKKKREICPTVFPFLAYEERGCKFYL